MTDTSQSPRELAEQIWRRKQQCWAETDLWAPTWRELAEFIRPNKKRAGEVRTPGGKQTERLYDPTAVNANRKLANFLNGAVISGSTRWFNLTTGDDADLMRDHEVAVWLDDTATRMYSQFQKSNLNAVAPQAFSSLSGLGSSGIFMDERQRVAPGFPGFQFRVIPLGQFACSLDGDGNVNQFYYEFELTATAAIGMFGEAKVPQYIKEAYESRPFEKFWFTQAIEPRPGKSGIFSTDMAYGSYIIDHREKHIVREKGFPEMPFFVPRWDTEEGEVYGRGCGHIALPDIRTLNKVKELGLQALALQVRPPLQVPQDGVLGGTARLTPAAQNVMIGDREIKPIDLGHDLKSEMVKGEELRESIKSCFHRDIVEPLSKNYMTATEVIQALELVYRELGPTLGNIQTGWLKPMVDRAFNMMYRAGAFLPVPEQLAGANLAIEYEGPLARAQRTGDMTALQTALALTAGVAQMDPQAVDNIDSDEVIRYQWEVLGIPTRILRKSADIKKIRESRAQAAEASAQAEQAQAVMDVAHTGAQAGKTMQEAQQVGNA